MQKICDQSSEMLIGLYWLIAQDHVGISALSLHGTRKTSIASWLLEMVLRIDKSPANCGKIYCSYHDISILLVSSK